LAGIVGITFFPLGYLLHALTTGTKIMRWRVRRGHSGTRRIPCNDRSSKAKCFR
jgi:hypothetical protein